MTFSRDDPRPRLTIRVNDDLKTELKELAEDTGTSMSEIARKAISNEVTGNDYTYSKTGIQPPAEKELRKAWKAMDRMAGSSDEITFENGLNILSQKFGKPENVILESIVKPLEYRGYLRVYPRVDSVIIRLNVRP